METKHKSGKTTETNKLATQKEKSHTNILKLCMDSFKGTVTVMKTALKV